MTLEFSKSMGFSLIIFCLFYVASDLLLLEVKGFLYDITSRLIEISHIFGYKFKGGGFIFDTKINNDSCNFSKKLSVNVSSILPE